MGERQGFVLPLLYVLLPSKSEAIYTKILLSGPDEFPEDCFSWITARIYLLVKCFYLPCADCAPHWLINGGDLSNLVSSNSSSSCTSSNLVTAVNPMDSPSSRITSSGSTTSAVRDSRVASWHELFHTSYLALYSRTGCRKAIVYKRANPLSSPVKTKDTEDEGIHSKW
uniref:Uncharacterized protein n=1 Tax=Ditylenchus dipsaci TaxID=166011 RepID=A0A915E2A1_9BILA